MSPAKLPRRRVDEIQNLRVAGQTVKRIAQQCAVSTATVSKYVAGERVKFQQTSLFDLLF